MSSESRTAIVELIREFGYEYREAPFTLASGELSHDYVDGKHVIATGPRLLQVCQEMADTVAAAGIVFDAVGGLTMGADPYAHGIVFLTDAFWFSVRKETKDHGRGAAVEGGRITPGDRILLVDDVVTTGGSTLKAADRAIAAGGVIVAATTLLDRGDLPAKAFAEPAIPYFPLASYRDLGIAPI